MKKTMKVLCLILALAMVVGCLTACGSKAEESEETTEAPAA